MKKSIVGLLGTASLLFLGYGVVSAQSLPSIGSTMTSSVISQPYQQSQCVEPDGSIVYVNRHFYLGDTYTTTDVVPRWGNGYDTLLLNASKVLIYNSALFNFTSTIKYKSNGIPNNAPVDSMVSAQGTFVVSSTSPGQLVYNIHRTALENAGSSSYSIAYLGRPNLVNYTAQLSNKTFHNQAGRVVNGYECVNYTVHYCGDGVVDTQQSIANLPGGFATSLANEQCDGTAGVPSGYTCTSTCTLQTIVVKPTCTLSVSPGSIALGSSTQASWTINGNYTNTPQITYTPTTWSITGLPYTVTTANGQRSITPQHTGTYVLSMTVSNSAGSSVCTAPIVVNPPPQQLQCFLSLNPNPVFVNQVVSVGWNVIGGNFFGTYIYVNPALGGAWPHWINANQYSGVTSVMPTQVGDYVFSMSVSNNQSNASCTGVLHVIANTPPTCSLTTSTPTITSGQNAILNGSYTHATLTTITPYIAGLNFTYPNRSNTNIVVHPTTTTTYTMIVRGETGTTNAVCQTTVNVTQPVSHLQCTLSVSPNPIFVNQIASVGWNVTGGNFFGTYIYVTPTVAGAWPHWINANQYNGVTSVMPTQVGDYVFSMSVNNNQSSASCTGILHVIDTIPSACSLTTSTPTILPGQAGILSASYFNASLATMTPNIPGLNFIYPNRSNPNIIVHPTTTTTYILQTLGIGGGAGAICTATINVVDVGLTLTKTLVNNILYRSGDLVSFRIDFSNQGTSIANHVVLTDYLPAGLEYVSSQIFGVAPYVVGTGINGINQFVEYSGFSLVPGQQGYMMIVGKFKGYQYSNQTLNNVFLKADNSPILHASALFYVYTPSANATITKTVNKSTFYPGEDARFTIGVTNNGPDTIDNVQLIDTWPNSSCVIIDPVWTASTSMTMTNTSNPYAWNLNASLPVGQTVYLYLTGHIANNPSCAGIYTNVVDLRYTVNGQLKTGQANVSINVIILPTSSMLIEKKIVQYGNNVGDPVVFELLYQNNGTATISAYDIVDYWPGTLTFVSASPSPASQTPTSQGLLLRWYFTTPIVPGGTGRIVLNGKIK